MPIMDGRGRVLAGAGGVPGSLDGTPIPFRTFGGGAWLDDVGTALESLPEPAPATLNIWDTLTGELQQLPRGANDFAAGGGAYIAWLSGYGLWGTLEQRLTGTPAEVQAALAKGGTCGPRAVAPDGTIAYIPDRQNGYGIEIVSPGGAIVSVPGIVPWDVQVLSAGVAIWRGGAIGRAAPKPAVPDAQGIQLQPLNGVDWLCYWSDQVGFVLQPDGEAYGWVLDVRPLEFNPSLRAVGNELRVAWSVSQGEGPGDVVVCALSTAARARRVGPTPIGVVRYRLTARNWAAQDAIWRDLTAPPPSTEPPPIDPPPIDPPPIDPPPIDPPPIKPPIDPPPVEPGDDMTPFTGFAKVETYYTGVEPEPLPNTFGDAQWPVYYDRPAPEPTPDDPTPAPPPNEGGAWETLTCTPHDDGAWWDARYVSANRQLSIESTGVPYPALQTRAAGAIGPNEQFQIRVEDDTQRILLYRTDGEGVVLVLEVQS